MTTPSPAQMDRKIRQLDNDVQSIYQMLNGIVGTQTQHGNRLDELDSKLGEMDAKLDTVITMLGEGR